MFGLAIGEPFGAFRTQDHRLCGDVGGMIRAGLRAVQVLASQGNGLTQACGAGRVSEVFW
jgi:hypothetical protein